MCITAYLSDLLAWWSCVFMIMTHVITLRQPISPPVVGDLFDQSRSRSLPDLVHRPSVLWRGGLVVGRRTCDLVVAGSRPGRDAELRNNLRQVVHTLLPLSPSSIIWYQRKLGSKQAYRVVHQPVSRGFPSWLVTYRT